MTVFLVSFNMGRLARFDHLLNRTTQENKKMFLAKKKKKILNGYKQFESNLLKSLTVCLK